MFLRDLPSKPDPGEVVGKESATYTNLLALVRTLNPRGAL